MFLQPIQDKYKACNKKKDKHEAKNKRNKIYKYELSYLNNNLIIFETTIILQRKIGINIKTKAIERK